MSYGGPKVRELGNLTIWNILYRDLNEFFFNLDGEIVRKIVFQNCQKYIILKPQAVAVAGQS